jgi:predicted TIM-barrel fold metal-dependent hydrolase
MRTRKALTSKMRIIDTHLHLIYRDRFTYEWLDSAGINQQWDAPSYFVEAERLGIEAALHMECGGINPVSEDETAFVLSVHPKVIGAIAVATPDTADFARQLERFAHLPGVRGIRRLLQNDPDDLSRDEMFRANVRRLAEHKLSFDLCVQARQLPIARELAAACPNVQFVLDHCGNPLIASGDISQWRIDLAELAALPNVVGKVSGIVNHAKPGWTSDDLRPVVEHVIESFGWNRVVWGSDRPVLAPHGGLTRWIEAAKEIVAGASTTEQKKLFSTNAARVYRL